MEKLGNLPKFISNLASVAPKYCDKCGARYSHDSLDILEESTDKIICKLECKHCKNSYLIHVSTSPDGTPNAYRTNYTAEITSREYKKFSKFEKINSEEILDMFVSLDKVKTIKDLEVLFEDSKSSADK